MLKGEWLEVASSCSRPSLDEGDPDRGELLGLRGVGPVSAPLFRLHMGGIGTRA